ncbi:hypothetical protein [Haloarcula litorea]|uniref:hypothetical protein n=1 Tax=Haloarcula litorea TaxID=3032579 RepID=UPI0023E8B3C6|nr:hypothetical protein [Halomicroarcula sp. GDY20]
MSDNNIDIESENSIQPTLLEEGDEICIESIPTDEEVVTTVSSVEHARDEQKLTTVHLEDIDRRLFHDDEWRCEHVECRVRRTGLPTTEEIIESLKSSERQPDEADEYVAIEGDIEAYHEAADGRVILRYVLQMGWDMDGSHEGEMLADEEVQEMTPHDVTGD